MRDDTLINLQGDNHINFKRKHSTKHTADTSYAFAKTIRTLYRA